MSTDVDADAVGVAQAQELADELLACVASYCERNPDPLVAAIVVASIEFAARVHINALTEETILNRAAWPEVLQRIGEALSEELRVWLEIEYASRMEGGNA